MPIPVQPQIADPSRDEFENQKQINNGSALATIMQLNQIQYIGELATSALLPVIGNEYDAYLMVDTRYVFLWVVNQRVRLDIYMQSQRGVSAGNTVVQTFADYNIMVAGVDPSKDGIYIVTDVNLQDPLNPLVTGQQYYVYDQVTTIFSLINRTVSSSPITTYVNKNGNDATGTVGDRAKPFLTIQAALNVSAFFGIVYVEDGSYTENLTDATISTIVLKNADLIGSITANFTNLVGDKTSSNTSLGSIVNSTYSGTITGAQVTVEGLNEFNGTIMTTGSGGSVLLKDISVVNIVGAIYGDGIINSPAKFNMFNCGIVNNTTTPLINAAVDPTATSLYQFKGIRDMNVSGLMNGMSDGDVIDMEYCNINSTINLLTGDIAAVLNAELNISHTTISTAAGSLVNVTGVGALGALLLNAYNSTIKCAAAENIVWATDPLDAVTLKSAINSKKTWNVAGTIINQLVNNDFIDANIT